MQNYVIDSTTRQPRRFGELYTDRNIRLVGEVRWNSGTNQIQTQNIRLISAPTDGGTPAITTVPDGLYSLSAGNTSVWVQLRRTSGSTTVVLGVSLLENVSAQQTPQENWVQLFFRSTTDDILTYGSFIVTPTPIWTRIGITRGTSIYDAIVGPSGNPFATHTTIQSAIDFCVDGNRILILEGTYSITAAGNAGLDPAAAFAWTGKTLTVEGEGWGVRIVNSGGLTRGFFIQGVSASLDGSSGQGSRVLSVRLSGFSQSVLFGSVGNGIRNCDVNLWMTAYAAYTAPTFTGAGVIEQNTVREKIVSNGGVHQEKYTIVSSVTDSNIIRTEASGTLTYEERVAFNRPTSGYGIIPLGAVLGTFPNLTGAYACTATTVADAVGFVQCNGQVIADATSPMNGVTVPNINNDVFLSGNVTAGTAGGSNTQNTSVPAAGLTTSGTNVANTASWNSANVSASGSGYFLKSDLNSNQNNHSHTTPTHSHTVTAYVRFYATAAGTGGALATIDMYMQQTAVNWPTSNGTAKHVAFNASGGVADGGQNDTEAVSANQFTRVLQIYNSSGGTPATSGSSPTTNGAAASWTSVQNPVTIDNVNVNKSSWNSDQVSHNHAWSGSVAGTATAATWNNRPSYITTRYVMRIK